MKLSVAFVYTLLCAFILGCSLGDFDKNYVPSIESLKPDETLIMRLDACHWGCTKGTIKFKNGKAIKGFRSLDLTKTELSTLDIYFARGEKGEIIGAGTRCSLPIEISFKQKKGFRIINEKSSLIYPCVFLETQITPLSLVEHFNEDPNEVPYWRLSPSQQQDRLD